MLPTFDPLRASFVTVNVAAASHASPAMIAHWQAQRLATLLRAARGSAIYAPRLKAKNPADIPLHTLPIIGVNTFRNPRGGTVQAQLELARSTGEEKQSQRQRLADFHQQHQSQSAAVLATLQQAVINDDNVFELLMDAVRVCSLGQITDALFAVGGQYRRSM